jgi:glycosyltransferase involved in cell wall biosynthesis
VSASLIAGRKVSLFVRDFMYSKFLLNLFSIFTHRIFFVSDSIKKYYSSVFSTEQIKSGQVIYVSSDMDKKIEKLKTSEISEFKQIYKFNDEFLVGYVGRLVDWKGYKTLERAAKILSSYQNLDNRFCFVIAGEPSSEEKFESKEIILNKNVRLVYTGFLSKIEILLSILDIFVHPAIEPEPYATGIVESMLAKCPVIATDLGGSKELVFDEKTGLLFTPGDEKELIQKILLLKKDNKFRQAIVNNAFKKVNVSNRIEDELKLITMNCNI